MRVLADRCQWRHPHRKGHALQCRKRQACQRAFQSCDMGSLAVEVAGVQSASVLFRRTPLADEPRQTGCHCRERKTAIVASYYLPEYVWLATGGKNGCFNADALRVLRGCQVILYPDIGATDQWRQKLSLLRSLGIEASIFNLLEEVATDDERTAGLDIADYLLQIEPDQAVLQSMIRRNPYLQTLIDELQLTLVSVERYNPDTDTFPKSSKTEKS